VAWGSVGVGGDGTGAGDWVDVVGEGDCGTEVDDRGRGCVREGGQEWITPRYSTMKEPGLRSLVAKRPACPHAGCAGSVI
jgi:hypothetical protein